ncbi:MAG: hypothetical protein PVH87_02415 [Desulfobacteraceae bacterium]|jgi:hypothetical protein
MEEHTQSKTQSAKAGKEKIVDLTADMELPDQTQHKIFDLTKDPDGAKDIAEEQSAVDTPIVDTTDTPETQSPVTPDNGVIPDRKHADDLADIPEDAATSASYTETATAAPIEETSGPPVAEASEATFSEKSKSIEDEVDAAFDAVQDEPTEPGETTKTDDQLFDKLSNITEEVDNAVRQIKESEPSIEAENSVGDAPQIDEEELSSDAADWEAAMAGADEEDEIIELTEVVKPTSAVESDTVEEPDDDIIELVDRVDPAELESIRAEEVDDDDDIIELTDIVDPAEIAAGDIDSKPAEQFMESADQVEAVKHGEPEAVEHEEEELALSDLDQFEPIADDEKPPTIAQDEFEPVETEDLFEGDVSLEEELAEKAQPEVDDIGSGVVPAVDEADDQQEQVIQLSNVLGGGVIEDRPPIEQIKMGAEEDIANQHISVEEEETANALGMDLFEKTEKEQQILSDKEIERTVEQIIQSKYADTIERMVANAVEKAVTQEIEKIKQSLSDDEPPT